MANQTIEYGDLVFAWSPKKRDAYLLKIANGALQGSRLGQLKHDDFVGKNYGDCIHTQLGEPFLLLRPTLGEYQRRVKRLTQIIFPKDAAFLIMHLNIGPGSVVLECGSGSGAMACAFAHFVGAAGHVYSYDRREEFSKIAQSNAARWGVAEQVTFKVRDLSEGFDERGADAVFLDVQEPWVYLHQAKEALKGGNRLGILVPTTNQIEQTLDAMHELHFADIQVVEIMLRYYKTQSKRIRPEDMMIGHTGFLILGSKSEGWEFLNEPAEPNE